jgi:hypothetical protein
MAGYGPLRSLGSGELLTMKDTGVGCSAFSGKERAPMPVDLQKQSLSLSPWPVDCMSCLPVEYGLLPVRMRALSTGPADCCIFPAFSLLQDGLSLVGI